MKRCITKFLIIFFIIGINVPFSSIILNNLKKASPAYSVLCKFKDDTESKKKTTAKNCLFCILKKDSFSDDSISSSCINVANLFIDTKPSSYLINLSYSLKNSSQKTRSPPFKS